MASQSYLEDEFDWQFMQAHPHGPMPEHQYKFRPDRKWMFDFAWPNDKLALEINGGTAGGRGAHSRGPSVDKDYEKWIAAQLDGWTVLLATASMTKELVALRYVEAILFDGKVPQIIHGEWQ